MKNVMLVSWLNKSDSMGIFEDSARDNITEPWLYLREYMRSVGYSLFVENEIEFKDADIILIVSYYRRKEINRSLLDKKTIYIMFEPPVVALIHEKKYMKKWGELFNAVFTLDDELVDNNLFFKLYTPMPINHNNNCNIEKTKLLCNISSNKKSNYYSELYSKREEAIKYFESKCPDNFDLYGYGWDNKKLSYKGVIDNKYNIFKQYKFAICYENMSDMKGYITEKIFDCFYAGVVPIYWGASNIEEYVPNECYIDKRKYDDYDKLYSYIVGMTQEEYSRRKQAINEYLVSEEYKKYLPESFSRTVTELVKVVDNDKKYRISYTKRLLKLMNLNIFWFTQRIIGKYLKSKSR